MLILILSLIERIIEFENQPLLYGNHSPNPPQACYPRLEIDGEKHGKDNSRYSAYMEGLTIPY